MGNIKRWHVGQKVYVKARAFSMASREPSVPAVIVELNETNPSFMSKAIVVFIDGTTRVVWLSDLSHVRKPQS